MVGVNGKKHGQNRGKHISRQKNSPYFYTAFGGEATISGCDKSASGDLVIPSEIDGYKVTAIRGHAFEGCSGIESVVVPASVTRIGCCAFERCGLEKIVLPDELREIASDTFAFCKNLREIKLPDSLLHIGIDAFRGCSALEAVTFPENCSRSTVRLIKIAIISAS